MKAFVDHFGGQSAGYAQFRPSYPQGMIRELAGLAPSQGLAWDCATGNGQAALLLAEHFGRVEATDASERQLEQAQRHPRIHYRRALAEASGLEADSVDLISVAQALHWFDLDRFYAEAQRVLKPSGVLAVWSYARFEADAGIAGVLDWFYGERIQRYWPAERRHVEDGYAGLPFPYALLPTSDWSIEAWMTRRELLGYVGTWSAVARAREAEGRDPLLELEAELEVLWPSAGELRRLRWPIALRAGRKPG